MAIVNYLESAFGAGPGLKTVGLEMAAAIPGKYVGVCWHDYEAPRSIDFEFSSALSGPETTTADGVVSGHAGDAGADLVQGFLGIESVPDGSILIKNGTTLSLFQLETHYAESLSESSTGNPAYQTKLTTDFTLLGGTYRVEVSGRLGTGANNNECQAKFTVNSVIIDELDINPSSSKTQESWYAFSRQAITAGAKTFIVEFKSPDSTTAKLTNVRISAERVGD